MRRLISILAVAVALPLWLVTAPAWVAGSIVVDVVGRLWQLPTLRLIAFAGAYLIHEWIGIGIAAWLWLTGGFGRRLDRDAHRRVQRWWAHSLLRWAERLLAVRFRYEDSPPLPDGVFHVVSRHASMVDAVLPIEVVTHRGGRPIHYVLKRELQWAPCLDLYGNRLGNYFVARGAAADGRTDDELAGIRDLAQRAEPEAGVAIFPEGTYATPRSRQRILASLRRNGAHDVAVRAEGLSTLLPPKPEGTLALLDGRPDADVVIMGHVGLEGVAQLHGLRRRLPLSEPVVVRWWVHARHELPGDGAGQTEWLFERWGELDRWVSGTIGYIRDADHPTT